MTPLERLKILVGELADVYRNTSLGNALGRWREWLSKEEVLSRVVVLAPTENTVVETGYEDNNRIVRGLEWYHCPNCGLIFDVRSAGGANCPSCHTPAVPAFVGAPKPERPVMPYVGRGANIWLVNSVAVDRGTSHLLDCPQRKRVRRGIKARGLRPADPQRPMMSLRFVCHVDGGQSCQYYNNHFCNAGQRSNVFLKFTRPFEGLTMVPVRPSEELTKPFIVTLHSVPSAGHSEELLREFREVLGDLVKDVKFADVSVWELQLFYTVGPPVTSRAYRVPVFQADLDSATEVQYTLHGRRLRTQGLYLELDFDRLTEVVESLNKSVEATGRRYDEFTVVHSLSHVLLNAVVNTAGVSDEEVSESVFFSREKRVAEILIYDNAPGGVDGVGAAVRNYPDLIRRLFYSARECPRRCRSACRACLYSTSCNYANTKLSWLVANRLLDWSKASGYMST